MSVTLKSTIIAAFAAATVVTTAPASAAEVFHNGDTHCNPDCHTVVIPKEGYGAHSRARGAGHVYDVSKENEAYRMVPHGTQFDVLENGKKIGYCIAGQYKAGIDRECYKTNDKGSDASEFLKAYKPVYNVASLNGKPAPKVA